MRDFDNWLSWYRRTQDPSVDATLARMAYDKRYFCTCESCTYRKEHGLMPVRMGPSCQAPLSHEVHGSLNG